MEEYRRRLRLMLLTRQITTAVRQNQKDRRTNEKDADLKLAKFDHRRRVYLAQPD